MTPKERISAALHHQKTDRLPFCPAIYEHKARLIDSSPSEIAQDSKLLVDAVLAEYEIYRPDMLTVGVDVYNIEAEALGCEVKFGEALHATPVVSKPAISHVDEVAKLSHSNPEKSARMPLMLEASDMVNRRLGDEVYVRGAITGPFSMAAELIGIEPLLMATILEPGSIEPLLEFCTHVAIDYGCAYLKRGVEVCVFDSQTSPPLVSPDIYSQTILPYVRKLITSLKTSGATFVEYVAGGDTSVNAANLFATQADILLSDFASDVQKFLALAEQDGKLVRRNISPILIEKAAFDELAAEARKVIQFAGKHPSIIIGTGVLSYNTPMDNVLLLREICLQSAVNGN